MYVQYVLIKKIHSNHNSTIYTGKILFDPVISTAFFFTTLSLSDRVIFNNNNKFQFIHIWYYIALFSDLFCSVSFCSVHSSIIPLNVDTISVALNQSHSNESNQNDSHHKSRYNYHFMSFHTGRIELHSNCCILLIDMVREPYSIDQFRCYLYL